MPGRGGPQPRQLARSLGSGFFISADGYVVTNNHVVDHAVEVEVLTDSGAVFDAKVIGADPKSDLALIKVEGHMDFPFVKLADTTPKIGEWVVAMGNPSGLWHCHRRNRIGAGSWTSAPALTTTTSRSMRP